MALVTAEFVKIYDLSVDKISPVYYFLLPMGKIKDATFVYNLSRRDTSKTTDSLGGEINAYHVEKCIVLMSSCGYLYYEEMSELTCAKNGVYYITNTIDFDFSEETEGPKVTNATSAAPPPPPPPSSSNPSNTAANSPFGSGVSVYYSFKLQLLFWSYQQGKSFMGAFKPNKMSLDQVSPLSVSSGGGSKPSGTSSLTFSAQQQALCNWSEIPAHPGLLLAMTLLSNNPVILMFLPDRIYYQEIKLTNNQGGPSKAKIQDMVATRHPSSSSIPVNSATSMASASTITSTNEDDEVSEYLNKKDNYTGILTVLFEEG